MELPTIKIVLLGFSLIISLNCSISDPGYSLFGPQRFSAYFNEPGISFGIDRKIDLELIKLIDNAQSYVHVAAYNLSKINIINAIIRAKDRGVDVKVVGDINEYYTSGYQILNNNKVNLSLGNNNGISHNKFAIVDGKYLFTGTGNFTENGFLRNNNNFFILENAKLANYYELEFQQMFKGLFDKSKRITNIDNTFTMNNAKVEVYFSPQQGQSTIARMIQLIKSAKHSIHYMIFAFSQDELSSALIKAARQSSILVEGIHDATFIKGISQEAARLYMSAYNNDGSRNNKGPKIYWDGNENHQPRNFNSGGKMHAKTMIIDAGYDDAILITGSFNWSNNAISSNDENLLVIHDAHTANFIFEQYKRARAIANTLETKFPVINGDVASFQNIIISEIGWGGSVKNGSSSARTNDDFIEIYNRSSSSIDLSHWLLQWGDDNSQNHFPIPDASNWSSKTNNIIAPGEYKIFFSYGSSSNYGAYGRLFDGSTTPNIKISSTKKFSLNQGKLNVAIYDKTMKLIDQSIAPEISVLAGANEIALSPDRTHSMQRRGSLNYTNIDSGIYTSSWVTSNVACSSTQNNFSCANFSLNTYATPGYSLFSQEPAKIINATYQDASNLIIQFNSNMTSCTTSTDINITEVINGSATLPTSFTLSTTNDLSLLVLTSLTGNFTGSDSLFKLTPTTSCKDKYGITANTNSIYSNGFQVANASVKLNEIAMKENNAKDYLELFVSAGGSMRNIKVFQYYNDSKSLIYQFTDLNVNKDDIISIELSSSSSNSIYLSEDRSLSRASPFYVYSVNNGLNSNDNVIYLERDGLILDAIFYSKRNANPTELMISKALSWSYNKMNNFLNLPEKPVYKYNEVLIQSSGIDISSVLSNGQGLVRSNNDGTGTWNFTSAISYGST